MQAAIDQFKKNMEYVRNLGAIYKALEARTTGVIDLSDVLRAELVMAVSALDQFVHEIVRMGMLEIYSGSRKATDVFLRFSVSLESVRECLESPDDDSWLANEIRLRHGWQSFQHADRIATAIRLISDIRIWEEVAENLGETPQEVRRQLNLVVDRRNKIAHEADVIPTYPDERWPIDESSVDSAVDFIDKIVDAMYKVL